MVGKKVKILNTKGKMTETDVEIGDIGTIVLKEDDLFLVKLKKGTNKGDTVCWVKDYKVNKEDCQWFCDDQIEIMRDRGFEEVEGKHGKHSLVTVKPKRGTKRSAGYDFRIKEDLTIEPGQSVLSFSDVRAYMLDDEKLKLHIRSGISTKQSIGLTNGVSIIDADYYDNPKTGGNIGIALHNFGTETQFLKAGERVCQGIFEKFLLSDDDDAIGERNGGFGSTGGR